MNIKLLKKKLKKIQRQKIFVVVKMNQKLIDCVSTECVELGLVKKQRRDMVKLLLVDDEKGITDPLREFFQDRGFHVNTADSGEAALEAIRKDKPNIIFLDIRMKGMDGLATLEEIKRIDKLKGVRG